MDKLKKMISPGHGKDDETMYDKSASSTGDGSHHTGASHSSHITGNDTGLNTNSTSGLRDESRLGGDGLGSSSTVPGNSSTVPGTDSSRHTASAVPSHLSGRADDGASTASIRSGVVGAEQHSGASGLGSHTAGTTGATSGHGEQGLVDRTLHQHAGPGHKFEHGQGPETPVPGYVHHVQGPHATDIANRLDPHVPGEFPTSPGETSGTASGSHTGTGLAGGALGGASALGSHQHGTSHHEAPLANTAGFEEQRFDPSSRSHNTTGATTTSGHQHQDNFGRNAALGGAATGVGAAGAYEATRHAGSSQQDPASFTTGPHSSNAANIVDPRVKPEPEKMKDRTTAGPHASDTLNRADPKVDSDLSKSQKDHHYGRDAAVAGGAGAAGVGAYEATRGTGSTGHTAGTTGHNTGSTGRDTTNTFGGNNPPQFKLGTMEPENTSTADRISGRGTTDKDHHYGRDAAVAGGAGAVGAGAYEATKSHGGLDAPRSSQPLATPTGAPQDARIFDQTQRVPDSKQTSGGWAADTKAQDKLQKERAKEAEKAHHKDEKAHHRDEKVHDSSADKGEKKHGILGFLHHDKSEPKDTPEERELKQAGKLREADQAAHMRHQRELEAAAAAGTIGVAGASFEPSLKEQQENPNASSPQRFSTDNHGHNKLHKDPSSKVQRELDERAREQGNVGGASSATGHTGTTGPTSHADPTGLDDTTRHTGHTGTTGTSVSNDGIVIEPRTGLPMNVGKYGSGTGGTDGSSTIHGYQN